MPSSPVQLLSKLLRTLLESRWLRIAFMVVAVVGFGLYVAKYWPKVHARAADISAVTIGLGFATVIGGLVASMLAYRALLADLGSRLPVVVAARIFFVGQLGKYVPGSLWPVVAQMEMGRDAGVPRQRSASAIALTILVYLGAGLLIGAALLPFSPGAQRYRWVAAVAVLIVAGLHPRILNPVIARLLVVVGRPPLEHPVSGRGIGAALGWSVLSWTLFGVHVDLLAHDLGADARATLPLAVGGFALAWSVGFLAVLAPAGAVVREAALIAVLAPQLDKPGALVVAAASRLLMLGGDLVTAGVAALAWRRGRSASSGDVLAEPL